MSSSLIHLKSYNLKVKSKKLVMMKLHHQKTHAHTKSYEFFSIIIEEPYKMASTEDYTPSLKEEVSSTYRWWFLVLAVVNIILGIILIVMGSVMCSFSAPHCHIWTGIPLLGK